MAATRQSRSLRATIWLTVLIYVSLFGNLTCAAPASYFPRRAVDTSPGPSLVAVPATKTATFVEVPDPSFACPPSNYVVPPVYAPYTPGIVDDQPQIGFIKKQTASTVTHTPQQRRPTGLWTVEHPELRLTARDGTICFGRGQYCVSIDNPCYKAWRKAFSEYEAGCEKSENICLSDDVPHIFTFCANNAWIAVRGGAKVGV